MADREHGRVQCLDEGTGEFRSSFSGAEHLLPRGAAVYGLDYGRTGGRHLLYAVTGERPGGLQAGGIVFDLEGAEGAEERFAYPPEKAQFQDGMVKNSTCLFVAG